MQNPQHSECQQRAIAEVKSAYSHLPHGDRIFRQCVEGQNSIAEVLKAKDPDSAGILKTERPSSYKIEQPYLSIISESHISTMSIVKTILITGANTGLGLEVVKSLCRSTTKYDILVGCRTPSKGQAAIDEVKNEYPSTSSTLSTLQVDLESDDSLQKAVETISKEKGHLDILMNNGGVAYDPQISSGAIGIREAWNKSWNVNVAGTQVLTTLAVPLLLKSSDPRLIFITSGTATLTETESTASENLKRLNGSPAAGWPKEPGFSTTSYRSSKTGLNMLMREWVRILKNDGVKVWCISPGFLATSLGGYGSEQLKKIGALDPVIGADFTLSVVEGKRDHDTGKIVRKDMIQPW
ncbi:uncharacterized protein KY384_000539 [Bacidia gigantensis]|uniref:uncharacterized protein n=1 Tax=Bacidia gigantensis TaxID=2732470 RepID=UPI001D05B654|nr:uncharacterized protein KY384_000539 [Bacidia gigantensis]KAG8525779.1 hypothetical protein KY384_000539 [Bacidia gigantensis]